MSRTSYTYDDLIVPGAQVLTGQETLLSGENRTRSTLLGKITTPTTANAAQLGKLKACDADSTDGSQVPYAILAEDCDATSADKTCTVYLAGSFNESKITLVDGDDAIADFKDALRDVGIFVVPGF